MVEITYELFDRYRVRLIDQETYKKLQQIKLEVKIVEREVWLYL